MGKVKVLISNNQTQIKIPVGIRMLVRRCCHAVGEYEGFEDDFEVSVSFVDDEQIHALNLEHRNIDRST
ncbi:MAG: rRNA maturation RNAse YbeY, partial [Ruminococcus sp.]|nr:rRNA maturation RNAse YbeY [Ruminococcus sp.]